MAVPGAGLASHLLDAELARLGHVALGEVQQRHAVVPRVARGVRLAVVACHLLGLVFRGKSFGFED